MKRKTAAGYWNHYTRNDTDKVWGYINANALGWDTKTWKFSTGFTNIRDARAFILKIFKEMKEDPSQNYKELINRYKPQKGIITLTASSPNLIRVFDICESYLKFHEPKHCLTKCVADFQIYNETPRFHAVKCETTNCPHRRAKLTYTTIRPALAHITEIIGPVFINDLELAHVMQVIDTMRFESYKDKTISNVLDYFKAAINRAVKEDKITINSKLSRVLKFRKELPAQYKLTDEIRPDDFTPEKFNAIIKEVACDKLKVIMKLAWCFPARLDELRTLKCSQFEVKRGVGILKFKAMKNGRPRIIKVPRKITNILVDLKRQKKKSEYLFSDEYGTLVSISSLEANFKRARELAGHEDVCIHQLRTRATTALFENGADPKEVMYLGGWTSMQTVMRYYRLVDNKAQDTGLRIAEKRLIEYDI